MTQSVTLSEPEWQAIINILGNAAAPWVVVNPLLMKLGEQLRGQAGAGRSAEAAALGGEWRPDGEDRETGHDHHRAGR